MVDDIQSGTQKGIGHRKYSEDECRADEDAHGGGRTTAVQVMSQNKESLKESLGEIMENEESIQDGT